MSNSEALNLAGTPPPSGSRYESLDLLRGIACLLVVLFHSTYFWRNPIGGGPAGDGALLGTFAFFWCGVPIFFVISGYCICASAMGHARRSAPWHAYFRKRIKRIYPPYLICIAFTILIAWIDRWFGFGLIPEKLIPNPGSLAGGQWVGNITLTETWRENVLGTAGALLIVPVAWTLCFEEQFYLVCGLSIILAKKYYFLVLALITAYVLSNCVNLNIRPVRELGIDLNFFDTKIPGTFIMGTWLDFALGCLVYWCLHVQQRGKHLTLAGLILVMGIVLVQPSKLTLESGFMSERLVAIVTAVFLLVIYRFDRRIVESRFALPFMVMGVICYSLYLTHFPIVLLVSGGMQSLGLQSNLGTLLLVCPLATLASLVTGLLFFRVGEYPFLSETQKTVARKIFPESLNCFVRKRRNSSAPVGD